MPNETAIFHHTVHKLSSGEKVAIAIGGAYILGRHQGKKKGKKKLKKAIREVRKEK